MAPVYPPGVLQKATIPDPTTRGGYLEITHFPEPLFEDFDIEEFETRDDMLDEILRAAEKDHYAELDRKIRIVGEAIDAIDQCEDTRWYARGDPWSKPGVDVVPVLPYQTGSLPPESQQWPLYRTWAHLMLWPLNYSVQGDEIEEVLTSAEQDRDYEEWMDSKEYKKSLKDYNLHRLLAWEKFSDGNQQHPKWSGQGTESDGEIDGIHYYTRDALLKERYRLFVDVTWYINYPDSTPVFCGTTPYGDVYIPHKVAKWIKEGSGCYEMDIALQDVEGAPGKKPHSFRWTCVHVHNRGRTVE
tara:strand:- start:2779 stop:3678 length:900 start_codon:yes stop_codon:yes gene_type:complete